MAEGITIIDSSEKALQCVDQFVTNLLNDKGSLSKELNQYRSAEQRHNALLLHYKEHIKSYQLQAGERFWDVYWNMFIESIIRLQRNTRWKLGVTDSYNPSGYEKFINYVYNQELPNLSKP